MYKPYPEAVDWVTRYLAPDAMPEDEPFEYEDWLWRMLSLHNQDATSIATAVVKRATSRTLSAHEERFMLAYISTPTKKKWLEKSTKNQTRRSLRNSSIKLDYQYLREHEKYTVDNAAITLGKKYFMSKERIASIVCEL